MLSEYFSQQYLKKHKPYGQKQAFLTFCHRHTCMNINEHFLFVFVKFKEPIKVAKPKPKRPSEEQKKIEKTKVELKRRIPLEFQDFGESKNSTNISHVTC